MNLALVGIALGAAWLLSQRKTKRRKKGGHLPGEYAVAVGDEMFLQLPPSAVSVRITNDAGEVSTFERTEEQMFFQASEQGTFVVEALDASGAVVGTFEITVGQAPYRSGEAPPMFRDALHPGIYDVALDETLILEFPDPADDAFIEGQGTLVHQGDLPSRRWEFTPTKRGQQSLEFVNKDGFKVAIYTFNVK